MKAHIETEPKLILELNKKEAEILLELLNMHISFAKDNEYKTKVQEIMHNDISKAYIDYNRR